MGRPGGGGDEVAVGVGVVESGAGGDELAAGELHFVTTGGIGADLATFDHAGHAPYRNVLKELTTLSRQLHGQTKMESLMKWQASNLHYLVVERDLVQPHEIPVGWGLLVREGPRLDLSVRPEWREVEEATRLTFLHRVAVAGTKATNRESGIDYLSIDEERRGSTFTK